MRPYILSFLGLAVLASTIIYYKNSAITIHDNNIRGFHNMSQAKIVIYTKDHCPFCVSAKQLLNMKKVTFEEIDTTGNDELRAKLVEMAEGRKTVPQIFINGKPYGGFDDINKLNKEGKLDSILGI